MTVNRSRAAAAGMEPDPAAAPMTAPAMPREARVASGDIVLGAAAMMLSADDCCDTTLLVPPSASKVVRETFWAARNRDCRACAARSSAKGS